MIDEGCEALAISSYLIRTRIELYFTSMCNRRDVQLGKTPFILEQQLRARISTRMKSSDGHFGTNTGFVELAAVIASI